MRLPLTIAVLGLSGCYVSHATTSDRPRPDASVALSDTSIPDGAFPDSPRRDAFIDAGSDALVPPPPDAGVVVDSGRDAGTLDASPLVDAGPARPALRFSAATYFEVEDSPPFDTPLDHSIELWVRSRESGDADFCQKGNPIARHLFIGLRGGRIAAGWQASPVADQFLLGPALVRDRWTHVAFVARAQGDGLYRALLLVDGSPVASEMDIPDLVPSFNAVRFTCGRADFDVDEIRVWRVGRNVSAIRAEMDRSISGAAVMVGYWRLDERGQIATDYSGSSNVGVLGAFVRADSADPTWIADGPF